MDKAKVFWTGRSQAVRLPKGYRIQAGEVTIRRHGNAIILEPIPDDWNWLDAVSGEIDADFAQAALEKPPQQEREALETLFE